MAKYTLSGSCLWWYGVVGKGIELNKTGPKGVKTEKTAGGGS